MNKITERRLFIGCGIGVAAVVVISTCAAVAVFIGVKTGAWKSSPNEYVVQARTAMSNSNWQKALELTTKALEQDPDYVEALMLRCGVFSSEKKFSEAQADCDRAIELSPKNALAYMTRAGMRATMKDYAQAGKDYDQAIALNPKSAGHHANYSTSSCARSKDNSHCPA